MRSFIASLHPAGMGVAVNLRGGFVRSAIPTWTMPRIAALLRTDTFVAVDVETASGAGGSICQIGLASYEAGQLTHCRSMIIRPEVAFDGSCTRIHGLSATDVRGDPVWREVWPELRRGLHGRTVVSHTFFDRKHIFAACCRSRQAMVSYRNWLDTCGLARLAWPEMATHTLPALAAHLGLAYKPHDAGEDARVAGAVLLAARDILPASYGAAPDVPSVRRV